MQPVVLVDDVIRFQENKLVRALLDWATPRGFGMNELALVDAHQGDHEQFAQLIGYSVSGFGSLSYARRSICDKAQEKVDLLIHKGKGI
jgi:hypothetical protein